ncbi:MAG: DPP IV N-terminal domain-containing protein, partial [Bacteroidales bacterium]
MKKQFLLAILFLSVCFPFQTSAQKVEKTIQLEDVYKKYRFMPRGIHNLLSMNDGEHYTLLKEGIRVDKFSYKTGEFIENILNLNELENSPVKGIESYTFSPNERYLLLMTNREKIYRHSFIAEYYIYDTNN